MHAEELVPGKRGPIIRPHLKRRNFRSVGPQKSHQKHAFCPIIWFFFFSQKPCPNNELNKGTGPVQKSPRKRALISEPVWFRYVSEVRPVV